MDQDAAPRRARKVPPRPELYSTVVIHDDDGKFDPKTSKTSTSDQDQDLYATMIYKGGDAADEEDDDDASLPPLLKRLPKDFGGGASIDYFDYDYDDNDGGNDFGTMIVKTDRTRPRSRSTSTSSYSSERRGPPPPPPPHPPRGSPFADARRGNTIKRTAGVDEEEEEDGDGFSTFVVRSGERDSVSGTVVRRTSGGGGVGSTMSRAVASMQAVGDLGFGNQRKGSGSSQGEESRQLTKMSSSSIPESVTREDPTTKYELLNELGKGSYGAVYKARDLKTSELVAIKVISLCEGEEGYEEIRGEIEMLQQCSHPNVVRYLGSYQGEEYLWIVMEYCGGGSVADLMNVTEEPLEECQLAYICREALKGLAYLHSIFKVHRDIKGGNILLTEQGDVKLGDFGVAAQLTRTMSKRNTFIGTPHWMAPEVIQESRYDGKVKQQFIDIILDGSKSMTPHGFGTLFKVDVWALGVSAIEMAEGLPPRSAVHPMRVLFMISIEPAPMLEDKEKWSLVFHDFVAKCLTKEPRSRPTASEMLKHKFIEKCKYGPSAMLPKIEKARQFRASLALQAQSLDPVVPEDSTLEAPKVKEVYGDTVPSQPQNVGQVANEGPTSNTSSKQQVSDGMELGAEGIFGTVIVHGGDEIDEKATVSRASNVQEPSCASGIPESPSVSKSQEPSVEIAGRISENNNVIGDLCPTQTVQAPSPSLLGYSGRDFKTKSSSGAQFEGGSSMTGSTLKSKTVSRKAFTLQDKLISIYAAGNTVPIPFLRATDISPIALLSDNVLGGSQHHNGGTIAVEALQELFTGDLQSKKGRRGQNEMPLPPSIYQRLTSSSTLLNLAQALAYHKTCYEDMPLQELQATQEQQTIQNLCDTLRTILRL